jgi:hypothetical protein
MHPDIEHVRCFDMHQQCHAMVCIVTQYPLDMYPVEYVLHSIPVLACGDVHSNSFFVLSLTALSMSGLLPYLYTPGERRAA